MGYFALSKGDQRFLQESLEKVSRSFALVIPLLEEPFNYFMATAYLICRVADNIEDCTCASAVKVQRFRELQQLIRQPADAAQILAAWHHEAWPGLTDDEVEMMGPAGLPLWQIYARIPEGSRASIQRWVSEMANGMVRFEGPEQDEILGERDGIRLLMTEADYNDYCFYVAGTVGHMASELAVRHYGLTDQTTGQLIGGCEACGRSLQKTNILKDFANDLQRGISYLPYAWHEEADFAPLRLAGAPVAWTRHVVGDILHELSDATDYVLALPYGAAGYRMATLMSLLPAYETLHLAATTRDKLFTADHHVKIPRSAMAKCKMNAQSMVTDNEAVRSYSERMQNAIKWLLA